MKTRLRTLLVGLALLSTLNPQLSTVLAQGTAFTYQGQLIDSGWPARGIYDLRFTTYDLADGGSTVAGPQTNSAVVVTNGLFTVTLDFGAEVFTGADRWLEIGVSAHGGGAFTTLTPRQRLTATPYAIRAANFSGPVAASQLTGIISPSNIGAGSISSAMLAEGAVTANKLAAGAVTTAALADGAVTAAKVFSVTNWLVLTITNPAPTSADLFGMGLAAVGSDRFMIGAPNAGAAYLFNINGELLTTITNPTAGSGFFGSKVAVMGNDRVLVGAIGVFPGGAAHLFSINGTLLTTITNPTPAFNDQFGSALAAVGSSGVLIGALNDSTSATNAGIAYLFSTNGTLVTTFTEPTPAAEHQFGISVAAMGSDRVLIGTRHDNLGPGAAYLFSTNGTLLTTFINPTPFADDNFGSAVTAVANNRVLIGAFSADRGGLTNAGAAYLFSTNGTLLTTFTNPTPASSDFFGASVEDAGNDRVLIGATFDDAGGFNAGAAYLFSSDGTLLATFINPTPAVNDNFGSAVAAVGSNRMLIGAFSDDAGADGAGVAHLFTFESFTPGLVAAGVRLGGVTSDSIAAGAVSAHQLAEGAVGSAQLAAGAVTTSALAEGAVTTTALADDAVTADKIDTVSDWFPLTIPNPTPAPVEGFAWSVAALGNGRVIIGASADDAGNDAGAAYLFSTRGVLLTTITNPTPEQFDAFGNSVAAVGSAMVLVGAPQDNTGAQDAGAAYLFTTNGVLITTFLNPTPVAGENFGESVAAVGANHVLIGSPNDRPGALHFGAAYLFFANGVLVNTFTNPTPASLDSFGFSVAGMGKNRVLIGATRDDAGATNAGVAHLFHTNGTLLMTFTNPTPEVGEEFGYAVAALGNDRVIIGALGDNTGGSFSGAAYLFSTNGTLLTTFNNPTPADFDNFGISVAAVGGDRVLIGAGFDSTGATNAGAAYLFTTNGVLITTLTNPAPEANDQFGRAVAVVGTNRVLIGANYDNVLTPDAGAAYLFTLESFSPGVIADGVRGTAITTEDLADGAVTVMKFDPSIGVWTRAGNNVYRPSGNVGIGTTTPSFPLHIARDTNAVMLLHDTGPDATQAGYVSFRNRSFAETAWVGFGTAGDPDFSIVTTRGDIVLSPLGGGRVGIATAVPTAVLSVGGNANNTTGAWGIFSDRRLKENIEPMQSGSLDRLLQLKGVTYDYNRPELREGYDGLRRGWIAQEVERVFPEWVSETSDGMKMLTPVGFNALAVEALRELRSEKDAAVEKLKAENAELKRSVDELKTLVNALTGKLNGGAR